VLASDRKCNRTARFAARRGFIIRRRRFGAANRGIAGAAFRPEREIFVRDLPDLRAMFPSSTHIPDAIYTCFISVPQLIATLDA
jgi:hypothetical protein